jgi:hypothetical protein
VSSRPSTACQPLSIQQLSGKQLQQASLVCEPQDAQELKARHRNRPDTEVLSQTSSWRPVWSAHTWHACRCCRVLFASAEWPSPSEPAEGGQALSRLHDVLQTSWGQLLLNPMAALTSLGQSQQWAAPGSTSTPPEMPPAMRWFLFLAIVPPTLNLIGSLFINVVGCTGYPT